MKILLLFVIFITFVAASEEFSDTNITQEVVVEETPKKKKVQPVISIDNRKLSVSVSNVKQMRIEVFLPKGRKIASRNIEGETTEISLPKSTKGEIIVTIDAGGRYYSQKIMVK